MSGRPDQPLPGDATLPLAESHYRTLVEGLPIGTYINTVDESLRTVYANPELVRMLGYEKEDWSRRGFFESIAHPDDVERVLERSAEARRTGDRLVDEYRLFHRDGSVVCVHDETVTVRDEKGRPLFRQGLLMDITARKRAEAYSVDRRLALELIAGGAPLDELMALLRRILAEHVGPEASLELHTDAPPQVHAGRPLSELSDAQRQVFATTKNQAVIAVERERREALLHSAELRSRTLVEQLPIGTYVNSFGPELRPTYVSPQLELMLGYDLEGWSQPGMYGTLIHPDDRERVLAASRRTREEAVHFVEDYRFKTKDGRWLWVHDVTVPVVDEHGEPYLLGFIQDIDERKQLEEQLLHAHKLEAVGRLAGGVAHDFNNLLTAITGYAELLLGQLDEGDPRRADAEEIAKAAQSAAELTRQLLAFGRRQMLEQRRLSLNDVLGSLVRLLKRLVGAGVELRLNLAPALEPVIGDLGQLEQVVVNLALNARDAMPDGGTLSISTASVEIGAGTAVSPGRYVELAIEDSGIGIDKALLPQIFEPFFTTKDIGKGTGLGLASVYGIVKQSGGHVLVESTPGEGTRFRVLLPPAE